MSRRLRVLISAYACSPYHGSEPGVGWGYVTALARDHDLWVLVEEEKFRGDIDRYLAERPGALPNVRFVFIPKQRRRWLRIVWPPSYYWYYERWHRRALQVAQELHDSVRFDIAHQLTMVGYREPGYLWRLPIPFVWGPIGGMGFFPWRFLHRVGVRGAVWFLAYNLWNGAQMRWAARPRMAARAAGRGLIAATPENADGAAKYWGCASRVVCEIGTPPSEPSPRPMRREDAPLRLVWSGEHVPRKALNLALDALAKVPKDVEWRLDVLGKGPRTRAWVRHAHRLGIADRCAFRGRVTRSAALEVLASADLMLITSLRDLTSTVTLEALAAGLPVICPDHCGFKEVVDDTCGILVAVESPSKFVDGVADAIATIARAPALHHRLSEGAVQRAAAFQWERNAAKVTETYLAVLGAGDRTLGLGTR